MEEAVDCYFVKTRLEEPTNLSFNPDARRAVLFPTVSHVYNSFPNYIPTTYVSNRCRSTHAVKKARL